jgi:hypothetical protein
MIDFLQNLQTEEHNFKETFESAKHETTASRDIPDSSALTGMEVRLSNVLVKDNKTPKVFPFPGRASIYFINIVISDLSVQPFQINLEGFEKVDDGDKLSIDRTLFFWKQKTEEDIAPSQIHIMSSLIKSKQKLREAGAILADIKGNSQYISLVDNISGIVKIASPVSNISSLLFEAAGIAGNYLGHIDDKPLLTWIQSFTDINGDFDKEGLLEKKASNKYASMSMNLTIRDKNRP